MTNVQPGIKGFATVPLDLRFWQKVRIGPDCWEWLGATRSPDRGRAYGMIWVDGKHRPASKVAWELHYGIPFPEGLDALHTCDNPPCVNPAHIYPGTVRDNAKDMVRKGRAGGFAAVNASLTHCRKGHPLEGANLQVDRHGWRVCRACRAIRNERGSRHE